MRARALEVRDRADSTQAIGRATSAQAEGRLEEAEIPPIVIPKRGRVRRDWFFFVS